MAIARWLDTDSLSNQDISSAVSIGAYTADADRMIVCDVSLDQVAGNGDYVIYVTRQINGAGSAYVLLPKTTCAAASGETAIAMQSGPITVRSGDVLTVMVDGLAGDTTTPDTTVRWFEMAALQPTDAGRTLDILATGEASANVTKRAGVAVAAADANGNDPVVLYGTQGAVTFGQVKILANVADEGALHVVNSNADGYGQYNMGGSDGQRNQGDTGQRNQGNYTGQRNEGDNWGQYNTGTDYGQWNQGATSVVGVDAAGTRNALGMAAANLDEQLDAIAACGAGSGAVSYPITVNNESSNPIDGVEVWVSTDSAGTNVVAGTLSTDASGIVTFMLDAGSYYVWRQKSGYNFTNPVAITVT